MSHKRARHDFTTTFDVIVGYFLAARTAEPHKHVHLEGEDPDVFSLYLDCVHSGIEALSVGGKLLSKAAPTISEAGRDIKTERIDQREAEETEDDPEGLKFEALIKLFLLADKLKDPQMMNLAIDEIVRMVEEDDLIPAHVVYLYEAESTECHVFLKTHNLHADFWRDVSLEYFRLEIEKDSGRSVKEVYGISIGKDRCADKCYYHQHDERHPRCE